MIIPQDGGSVIGPSRNGPRYVGHTHFWERAMMSRREFIGAAAGATGVVLGSGLWMPGRALADGSDPKPIPGSDVIVGGKRFHVFLPAEGSEPITITDFHGSIGLAHVQGTGRGINTETGHHQTLSFDVDNRFMQGTYIGMDGEKHQGTFGFIWLDLFQGQVATGTQIHDFNPGIAPSGLFWTIRIPDESVEVDIDNAIASMDLLLETKDFFTIPNSLMGGHHVPGIVSFKLRWSGVKKRVHTRDAKNHFVGDYIEDTATVRWSAREKGFKFVSDPAHTSTTVFAEIGRERNGVFFS